MKWEQIDHYHCRCKVPGGWLFKAFENVSHYLPDRGLDSGWDFRVAVCFVPDPNHEWILEVEE